MVDKLTIEKAAKSLGKVQRVIIEDLLKEPLPINRFSSTKSALSNLYDRKLIEIKSENIHLTRLGECVHQHFQEKGSKEGSSHPKSNIQHQKRLEKSNEFLELYKYGLTYQDIGDGYNLTRERVRQILKINPAFHEYLEERKKTVTIAEQEKKERAKQEFYSKSLATLYPERVTELWDYEKNGDLKPQNVPAGTTLQYVWFKCPLDGHSWKKIPAEITRFSWDRNRSSGCPICSGKTKKPEKQPKLLEAYPELIRQYWDYEKNNELSIDPSEASLGSNKKVWFKCDADGYEWQASIVSTVIQQWSKGNAGCRVCNGTVERKRGEWQRRESIAVEFPDEVSKYWFYEANNELGLDPMKLTMGSSKEAFFKCPVDSHEWIATITAIAKGSWKKGNSGCPACRGFVATKTTSLISLYPDYVAQYWDYGKNNELAVFPDRLTRGSQQEAWFKCPIDGYEWRVRIGGIAKVH